MRLGNLHIIKMQWSFCSDNGLIHEHSSGYSGSELLHYTWFRQNHGQFLVSGDIENRGIKEWQRKLRLMYTLSISYPMMSPASKVAFVKTAMIPLMISYLMKCPMIKVAFVKTAMIPFMISYPMKSSRDLILMKLSDPKSLLRSSLVSKHFASILFQSQSLSLQLPSSGLSSALIPFDRLPPEYKIPNHSFNDAVLLRLTKLVSRFTSIRTLHIELSCDCPQYPFFAPDHGFSWDFKVGHNLKTFAILSNTLIEKINEVGSEVEDNSFLDKTYSYSNFETSCLKYYAFSIHPLLLLLVSQHPNIESVEIVDSGKHGKVSVQGEQLIKLKDNMSKSMPPPNILEQRGNSIWVPGYFFTVWYVLELPLPRSGLVMKRVALGIGAENMFPGIIDDRIKGLATDFGDDIFGEALSEILTNYYISGRRSNYRLRSLNDNNSWETSLWATLSDTK